MYKCGLRQQSFSERKKFTTTKLRTGIRDGFLLGRILLQGAMMPKALKSRDVF
jgi:hypothetical protein